MKLKTKTLSISLILTVLVFLCIGGIIWFFYSGIIEKVRYENIRGIATAMTVYAKDYDTLPPSDEWCDKLIAEADCDPRMFQSVTKPEKDICGYALNKNLDGLKFSDLNDEAVLAFESKGLWNLGGGPELMKKSKQKKIAVVFVDGHMEFVKIEDSDKLKWKP